MICRETTFRRAALLAALLALVGCPKEKTPAECATRADCLGGAACRAGTCQPCPAACGSGEICLEGACHPTACGDRPCRAGEACVEGTCRAADCAEVTCPAQQACAQGSCYPAECGETACLYGEVCVDGECREPSCVGKTCAAGEVCAAGECLSTACSGIVCAEGNACQGGRCVSTRCVGIVCAEGTACADGRCVSTACQGVRCLSGEACLDGACTDTACVAARCPEGEVCAKGTCYPTACLGVECAPGNLCEGGRCVAPRCATVSCDPGSVCYDGSCVADACAGVPCPEGQGCVEGACVDPACVGRTCEAGLGCAGGACLALPASGSPPSISGVPVEGAALTADDGTWTGAEPLSLARQWQSCDASGAACTDLAGETGASYRPVGSDVGRTLRLQVTATNAAGSLQAASARTAAVAARVPLTILSANPLHARADSATFDGECSAGLPIAVSGAASATVACSAGTWSYTTPAQTTDGSRDYVFVQDGGDPVTGTFVRDTTGPVLVSTSINGGAAYATTPLLTVEVAATDETPPVAVRVAEAGFAGDCQGQYADDRWQDPAQGQLTLTVAPLDGSRKVCAWARDALGNVSAIAPSAGTLGVDADAIEYQAGNIPKVTALSVSNGTAGANFGTSTYAAGDTVQIAWTATDVEGLADGPISIYVTTDGSSWTPVVERTGGPSGNPTSFSGSYTFAAPSAAFFRLKVVAWDLAGNSSFAIFSDSQNTPRWSVYAGSTDTGLGGTARSSTLQLDGNGVQPFDVDPLSGAVYALTSTHLVKMDPATGLVSAVMRKASSTNLPDDGPLPADPTYSNTPRIRFDSDGLLYVLPLNDHLTSAALYQVDLARGWCRRYLGGGTANDGSATPSTVDLVAGAFAVDESHSLYFQTNCTPGSWTETASTLRLLKVTQNPDQTAGAVSVVAGNCVRGTPSDGAAAQSAPLTDATYPGVGALEVWNDGAVVYYGFLDQPLRKILGGRAYASDAPGGYSLFYDRAQGRLYLGNGALYEVTPDLSGAGGDTATVFAAGAGTAGDCLLDGVDAAQACVINTFGVRALPQGGPVLFMDGKAINEKRAYRLRFKDSQGALQTLLGTLPFSEPGANRRVVRASFAGIYYKQAGELNQAAFPAGLYFLDSAAPLFGYLDPATEQVSVLWGNQHETTDVHAAGTALSASLPMGRAYTYDARSLAFDSQGLPWLRYNGIVVSADASRQLVLRQQAAVSWETAVDGDSPSGFRSYINGTMNNLTLRGAGFFLVGGAADVTSLLSIQLHDFGADRVTWMMGKAGNAYSPDTYPTLGTVYDQSLALGCFEPTYCHHVYQAAEDALYFGELDVASDTSSVRSITTPATRATSTLRTLFSTPAGVHLHNFVFSPDATQVFYLTGAGDLRCHDLTSGKAWCNDTRLGPPTGLRTFAVGPNSLTWRDSGHLLVSNYQGEIYEYTLPP